MSREDRTQLFENLAHPESTHAFFERLADDVDCTGEGTRPLAGRYTDKKQLLEATFDRLGRLMRDAIRLELRHLFLDGAGVVVELRGMSTTMDGAPYDNTFCWVCRCDSAELDATPPWSPGRSCATRSREARWTADGGTRVDARR